MTGRRPDIDNLRTAATLLLIPFHTAKVFDERPFYHLKDERPIATLDVFTSFVHQWHMPLFFTLAGWSAATAFGRRSPREYRVERVRKLLLPLLIGSVLLGPVVRWIELDRIDGTREEFWAFLPTFFTDLDRFTWSHLWFLAYLFTLSMALQPLFRRLHERARPLDARSAHLVGFVALLVLVQVALRAAWPGFQNLYDDWANVTYYGLFLLGGFLLGRFESVDRLVDEHRAVLGRVGLAASAAMVPFWLDWIERPDGAVVPYLAYQVLSGLAGIGLVGAILGWGRRHLAGAGAVHAWGRARAFPIYVLHQLAVVVLAVHVVDRSIPSWPAFALVLSGTTALSLLGAAWLPRVRVLRPLFGLGRRVGSEAPTPSEVERTP